MGGFCPLVELHREGSAPAACAAGLFKMCKQTGILFTFILRLLSECYDAQMGTVLNTTNSFVYLILSVQDLTCVKGV